MTENNCSDVSTDLHYSIQGDGPSVVLVHGIAASNNDWVYMTPDLIDCGYRVIAPDLIGHGNSNKPQDPGCYTFTFLYQHFVDWITTVNNEQKIILVGSCRLGHTTVVWSASLYEVLKQGIGLGAAGAACSFSCSLPHSDFPHVPRINEPAL